MRKIRLYVDEQMSMGIIDDDIQSNINAGQDLLII